MARFEHGLALLIGVDESKVPGWSLPAVAKDIAALEQVLTHPDRCAYLPENIRTVRGAAAARQGILDGLGWLQAQLQAAGSAETTVIIHYSGHGWRDASVDPPVYYQIPYDARPENLRISALRAEDFAEAVRALNPRRLLVIFDCCHAGGMDVRDIQPGGSFQAAALPPEIVMGNADSDGGAQSGARAGSDDTSLHALAQGQGRAVLSASRGEQSSYNRRDGAMGIFTYHLIEALTGHAQPQEGAAEVLVSDVMSHVWRSVPRSAQADWGKEQQPDFQVSGNFPVALLLGGRGWAREIAPPDPLEPLPPTQPVTVNIHSTVGDQTGGDKITLGNISGSQVAAGRQARVDVPAAGRGAANAPGAEANLERLFGPLYIALLSTPAEMRAGAFEKMEVLRAELSHGGQPDDTRLAQLLDELLELAPELTNAAVELFAAPALAALAGPVTRFVLDRHRRN